MRGQSSAFQPTRQSSLAGAGPSLPCALLCILHGSMHQNALDALNVECKKTASSCVIQGPGARKGLIKSRSIERAGSSARSPGPGRSTWHDYAPLRTKCEETVPRGNKVSFSGKIGKTIADSRPSWPEEPVPPAGAPNIRVVLFDDV